MFLGFDSVNSLSFVKQQAILMWQFFFFCYLRQLCYEKKCKSKQYVSFSINEYKVHLLCLETVPLTMLS